LSKLDEYEAKIVEALGFPKAKGSSQRPGRRSVMAVGSVIQSVAFAGQAVLKEICVVDCDHFSEMQELRLYYLRRTTCRDLLPRC